MKVGREKNGMERNRIEESKEERVLPGMREDDEGG
jgi:hypothetical protein